MEDTHENYSLGDLVFDIDILVGKRTLRSGVVTDIFDGGFFLVHFSDKKLPVMCLPSGVMYNGGAVMQKERFSTKAYEIMLDLLGEGAAPQETEPEEVEVEVILEGAVSAAPLYQGSLF